MKESALSAKTLTKDERQAEKDEKRFRSMCREVRDEHQLRRILSDVRDFNMRVAVFMRMKPYLNFNTDHMFNARQEPQPEEKLILATHKSHVISDTI